MERLSKHALGTALILVTGANALGASPSINSSPRTLEHWMRAQAILASGGEKRSALRQVQLGLVFEDAVALLRLRLRLEVDLGLDASARRTARALGLPFEVLARGAEPSLEAQADDLEQRLRTTTELGFVERRADLLHRLGRWDQAAELRRLALRLAPDNKQRWIRAIRAQLVVEATSELSKQAADLGYLSRSELLHLWAREGRFPSAPLTTGLWDGVPWPPEVRAVVALRKGNLRKASVWAHRIQDRRRTPATEALAAEGLLNPPATPERPPERPTGWLQLRTRFLDPEPSERHRSLAAAAHAMAPDDPEALAIHAHFMIGRDVARVWLGRAIRLAPLTVSNLYEQAAQSPR